MFDVNFIFFMIVFLGVSCFCFYSAYKQRKVIYSKEDPPISAQKWIHAYFFGLGVGLPISLVLDLGFIASIVFIILLTVLFLFFLDLFLRYRK